jgi:hypothetical protein
MRRKVMVLFIWTTMTFWFGGCAGDLRQPQAQPTDPHETSSADAAKEAVLPPPAPAPLKPPIAPMPDPSAPIPATLVTADSQPSLHGIDRSHWDKLVIGAEPGYVPHHPAYFTNENFFGYTILGELRPSPLYVDQPIELSAAASTRLDQPGFPPSATWDLLLAPLKVGYDVVLLPYNVFVHPPMDIDLSP